MLQLQATWALAENSRSRRPAKLGHVKGWPGSQQLPKLALGDSQEAVVERQSRSFWQRGSRHPGEKKGLPCQAWGRGSTVQLLGRLRRGEEKAPQRQPSLRATTSTDTHAPKCLRLEQHHPLCSSLEALQQYHPAQGHVKEAGRFPFRVRGCRWHDKDQPAVTLTASALGS